VIFDDFDPLSQSVNGDGMTSATMTSDPSFEPQQQQQFGDHFQLLEGFESTATADNDNEYGHPSRSSALLDDWNGVGRAPEEHDQVETDANRTEVRN